MQKKLARELPAPVHFSPEDFNLLPFISGGRMLGDIHSMCVRCKPLSVSENSPFYTTCTLLDYALTRSLLSVSECDRPARVHPSHGHCGRGSCDGSVPG
ncbi:hypothetical protein RRG08_060911 [Elysia crispata]|uniref:Uncharacterized protein n=1 Tax=Elysia crispata TaxID=231223 RepID=A0AAE1D8L5_9GAST|nr:hypothetical protein RRG08_060911 [Elysia crispata]